MMIGTKGGAVLAAPEVRRMAKRDRSRRDQAEDGGGGDAGGGLGQDDLHEGLEAL